MSWNQRVVCTGTNLPDNAQTTNDTFDSYLNNLVWGQIDGRYAGMASDLAMVVGSATYGDMGATYRNNSVDRSALDRVMELTSGVRVSAHVPAPASNRQNVVIRRGMSMTAVAPTWEGVTLIPDEITKAKEGQIVITAVMLYSRQGAEDRRGAGQAGNGPQLGHARPDTFDRASGRGQDTRGAAVTCYEAATAPTVAADFQALLSWHCFCWNAYPVTGRYLATVGVSGGMVVAVGGESLRQTVITFARDRDIDLVATNSATAAQHGGPTCYPRLGPQSVERIIDPGFDVVTERLSNPDGTH